MDIGSVASPSCAGIPLNFYARFAAVLGFVIIVIALPWLFSLRFKLTNQKERWHNAVQWRLRDTFLLVLLFHPTLSGQAFNIFRCKSVVSSDGSEKHYLMADFSIECFDGQWSAMVALVAVVLIFFSFGMPIFFAAVLWRRRNSLQDEEGSTFRFLGMVYHPYKVRYYYFESVQMIFKLVLWMALVFFPDGDQFQHAAILFICFIQVSVHAHVEPFSSTLKNALQYLGLAFMTFAAFAGLVLNFLRVSRSEAVLRLDEDSARDLKAQTSFFEFLVDAITVVFLVIYGLISAVTIRKSLNDAKKKGKVRAMYRSMRKRASSAGSRLKSRASNVGTSLKRRTSLVMRHRSSSRDKGSAANDAGDGESKRHISGEQQRGGKEVEERNTQDKENGGSNAGNIELATVRSAPPRAAPAPPAKDVNGGAGVNESHSEAALPAESSSSLAGAGGSGGGGGGGGGGIVGSSSAKHLLCIMIACVAGVVTGQRCETPLSAQ
eukprot:g60.t1